MFNQFQKTLFRQLKKTVAKIKSDKPLILNLTNTVTQDLMANSLLALGCAPIMSNSAGEVMELAKASGAININIGTLNENFMQVATAALAATCPVVLDPVGCGATRLRTESAKILAPHAAIIRGNASEIMAMSGDAFTKGVESLHASETSIASAQQLSKTYGNVCVISGEVDYVIGGQTPSLTTDARPLCYGSPLMARVTGMGCTLTALIAAFHAVEKDAFTAAYLATAFMGLIGSQAARQALAPGSFRIAFIDGLYAPDWTFIEKELSHAS